MIVPVEKVFVCRLFATWVRVLSVSVAAVCVGYLPGSLWGQASQWTTGSGGAIYYNGGNVGIGTTAPTNNLTIDEGSSASQASSGVAVAYGAGRSVFFQGGDDAGYLYNYGSGGFFFYVDGAASQTMAMAIANNGNVGIGTTAPPSILSVKQNSDSDVTGGISVINAGGTSTRKVIQGGDNNTYLVNQSTNAIYFATGNSSLGTFGVRMSVLSSGNVGIGTTAPQYQLSVNGTIGTKEVIVTSTGWPDYVFKPDYRLLPLNETAAYIKEHHHLPEIPSESEVQEKGVSLGDMQAKLLAKVEELTLHMIQADERNGRLEQQNRQLQKRIARLEAQNLGAKSKDSR